MRLVGPECRHSLLGPSPGWSSIAADVRRPTKKCRSSTGPATTAGMSSRRGSTPLLRAVMEIEVNDPTRAMTTAIKAAKTTISNCSIRPTASLSKPRRISSLGSTPRGSRLRQHRRPPHCGSWSERCTCSWSRCLSTAYEVKAGSTGGSAVYPAFMHAIVVGAGVSGLTTASALVEAGWSVDIVARHRHPDTVSVVAAAIWTTTNAEPQVLVRQWALATRERFAQIATDPSSGIAPLVQREFERVDPGPSWWESTPYVRRLDGQELPKEFAAGIEIDGFIIEPPTYLDWLTNRLIERGVTIAAAAVDVLDDLEADVIVNCAGLAARELIGDDTMFPIRGQVVAVANRGITEGVSDESDTDRISYVYPRSREVILGGARQIGNEATSPDDDLTARILSDAAQLDPLVAGAEVLDVRVGLRPGRPQVRVEASLLRDGRTVVHNYGHSGAGFLLSWGCALDVVDLANAAT